jgi:hypothetical protein
MSRKSFRSVPPPVSGRPPSPKLTPPNNVPAEPLDVLGRHKNTGQKDHKGAR